MDDIIFDCDSTLSTLEGIDELARLKGMEARVAALTNAAMDGSVALQDVYGERLRLLQPSRAELRALELAYRRTVVPDAREVITALHALGKRVYIVSGGLADAVIGFGVWLGVPRERIFAVGLTYDPDGRYLGFADSPLATANGKNDVIRALRAPGRSALLVGDGASDLAAAPSVDLFIGFGGVVARPLLAARAAVFITTPSLAPVMIYATREGEGDSLPVKRRARATMPFFHGHPT